MFNKYFLEVRNRTILILFSWGFALLVSYLNKETLLFLLIKPNLILFKDKYFYFIATNLTDMFSAYLHLSYFVAFQTAIVFGLLQLKSFIAPALYKKEHQQIHLFYRLSLVFLLLSILFLHNIVLQCCWRFFSSFQNSSTCSINIFLEMRVTEYLSFYILIYYITVLIGQAFVFVFLMIDALEKKLLFIKKTRKIFYLSFFLLATVVTPPDVISQIFLGSFFIIFYELIIITIILRNFNIS